MANGTQTVSAVITADAKPFKRSVQDAGNSFDGFSKSVKNFGVIAGAAILGASAAMGAFIGKSIEAAAESEAVAQGLKNAAENAGVFAEQAGGIAGVTEELQTFAKQLGETIGLDDEKILGIVSQWLAVPQLAKLGVGGLKNLVKVAADVAAGTNKDLDTIATAFVKVAGDGESALSKLLRAGIVFTDEQKAVYQSLLDSNDELGAQQYLIDTLGTKYAGAAESIANPFDRLKTIFENFQEEIGQRFLPVLGESVDTTKEFLDNLVASPEFAKFIGDMVVEFEKLLPKIFDLVPKMLELGEEAIPLLIDLLPILTDSFGFLADILGETNDSFDETGTGVKDLTTFLQGLIGFTKDTIYWMDEQVAANKRGEFSWYTLLSPVGLLTNQIGRLQDAIKEVIDWWNALWGLQQDKPLSQVGSADYLDRVLTPPPQYADDRRMGARTVNISVNAIAPSAEVGRAVVDSIKSYQRAGGTFA